ncbi:MAG: hypothetical protein ABJB22_07570 [Verrucomicrobiota bacterium]
MNPDKLFDYLDGNLSAGEREQLEKRIAEDSQLQRELAIARKIHRGMGGSRELLGVAEETAGTKARGVTIGRQVAIAFFVLVLVNVFIGISFIVGRKSKNDLGPQEAAIRAQLAASLEKTAGLALPTPTLADEIKITAPANERDALAGRIMVIATEMGGSGTKGLPDPNGTVVWVEVLAHRENSFRGALVPLGAPSPPAEVSSGKSGAPNEKKILQIRISGVEPSRTP